MPDMRDILTEAIQSYGRMSDGSPNMLVMAMAPALAEHLVTTIPLVQQWAVGALVDGKLDEIEPDTDTEVRDDAVRELATLQENARRLNAEYPTLDSKVTYALYTSFGIDWIPEVEPDIEEDLARLVLNDEDDGQPEPQHDWQPTGFTGV